MSHHPRDEHQNTRIAGMRHAFSELGSAEAETAFTPALLQIGKTGRLFEGRPRSTPGKTALWFRLTVR